MPEIKPTIRQEATSEPKKSRGRRKTKVEEEAPKFRIEHGNFTVEFR